MQIMISWLRRFAFAAASLVLSAQLALAAAPAAPSAKDPASDLRSWYGLVLELIRHTATYTPPVAARALGYLGVTAWEATASGDSKLQSLAGQLNEFKPVPAREAGQTYDETLVMNAALETAVTALFWNTGPTGQHATKAMTKKLAADAAEGKPADVVERSNAYGKAVAEHILAWAETDGGAKVQNMGFPVAYQPKEGPSHWVPTSPVRLQQAPLLPEWGKVRPFAMKGDGCPVAPHPEFSEAKDSAFYKEAEEVYLTVRDITPEQKAIARFWSDDPMLTPTPPGHWVSIVLQIMDRDQMPVEKSAQALAATGMAVADGFIGCWRDKFIYDLVRPVTYIKKNIDPKWETILITPPFPEFPSGHSTESGAAAEALTAVFGDNFAFDDATHQRDGIKPRHFDSFWAAAEEAGISRLYGGIHYRAAIELGLEQGRCIGKNVAALKMVK